MKGFTLIELLIVMSIAAIIATIGGLTLFSYRPEQDLDLAVKSIVTVLRDTQQKSIAQESESQWGVHFENVSDGRDFYATFSGPSYSTSTAAYYLKSELEFSEPANGLTKDIIFAKVTGLPQSQESVKIRIANKPESEKTITINSNGKVEY